MFKLDGFVFVRLESGYHSDLHISPTSTPSSQAINSTDGDDRLPTGALLRRATYEELLSEGSPFAKKHVRVAQDPVGYGIVLRGDGPVHVKVIDPMGPAAKAGLKVRVHSL